MIRTIIAYAIVKKIKPKIIISDIYSKDQLKDIRVEKDERIIKVEIKAI